MNPTSVVSILLVSSCALGASSGFVVAKNTACKLFVGQSPAHANPSWHGVCKNGFADGLGVIRYLLKGQVESTFYGTLKAGYWDHGVEETKNGYKAGKFKKNEPAAVLDSNGVEDPNVIIGAFDIAAKAAQQLSQEFLKQGNKASATLYKQRAERLSNQMD